MDSNGDSQDPVVKKTSPVFTIVFGNVCESDVISTLFLSISDNPIAPPIRHPLPDFFSFVEPVYDNNELCPVQCEYKVSIVDVLSDSTWIGEPADGSTWADQATWAERKTEAMEDNYQSTAWWPNLTDDEKTLVDALRTA